MNEVLPTDEEIIEMYFMRKEDAICETDKKYRGYLHTIAYNILKNDEDSKECLSDTYFKTWNAIPPERPRILRAFLAKITRGTALDRYDESTRQRRIPKELCLPLSDLEGVLSAADDIESRIDAMEIGRVISAYLNEASDFRMYIFVSRYFFVMPIRDIAKKLLCSESKVNKELAFVKNELRQRLIEEGVDI